MIAIKPIRWVEGNYSCFTGWIGKNRVCTVVYASDSNKEKPWRLYVEAFGCTTKAHFVSQQEAFDAAPAAISRLISMVAE